MNENAEQKDIQRIAADNLWALEENIPCRLNIIYKSLVDNRQGFEPWQLALTCDLAQSVEYNVVELSEACSKDRLPTATWLARNLLELWVWTKYCSVSRDYAWRFHEDALRDFKGLMDLHQKGCDLYGLENKVASTAAQRIKKLASDKLGLNDIDSKFFTVLSASNADGVNLKSQYETLNRTLSKYAHPTAGLIHGTMHQKDHCRDLQVIYTTHGVFFAHQSASIIEQQLGILSD